MPTPDQGGSTAVTIEAECAEKVSLASAGTSPVIRALRVTNGTGRDLEDVDLSLEAVPSFLRPRTWRLDRIAAGGAAEVSDLGLEPDAGYLAGRHEPVPGRLELRAASGGEVLATRTAEVSVLAPWEWGGLADMEQALAAFVIPGDPVVSGMLGEAHGMLESAGHGAAPGGNSRTDPGPAWMTAAAVWSAATSLGLSYAEPPGSFEQEGQRVRDPGRMTAEGLATPLDASLLLAAALEEAGLRPVVAFVRGHCLAGVWLRGADTRPAVGRDPMEVRKAIAMHELEVFDAAMICSPAAGFEEAVAEARRRLGRDEEHNFECVIDIERCRAAGIAPLVGGGGAGGPDAPRGAAEAVALPPMPDFGPPEDRDGEPADAQGRIERWKDKLLDLSGRNRLLNFRPRTKQGVMITCPDIPRVAGMLEGGEGFAIMALREEAGEGADPPGDAAADDAERAREALERKRLCAPVTGDDLARRLTALYRKAKSDMSEGGTNTLFLAVGFLRWKKTRGDRAERRAPLVLIPVRLTRKSALSGYRLSRHEDDARFNSTLLEMLRRDFGLGISIETADAAEALRRMRHEVRNTPGFEVTEEVALSTFSFAKHLMWEDLVSQAEELRGHRLLGRLVENPESVGDGGEGGGMPDPGGIDRTVHPRDVLTPLPADSSQLTAVLAAEQGRDFVIIGPPGTGKSQTIANIIAHCLAKQKTVLFVAEKSAALDVVYRRLRQNGLGDACLELHSNKADRSKVLRQFGAAWARASTARPDEWARLTRELKEKRDRLNGYVEALHAPASHGLSVFEAVGIASSGEPPFALSFAGPGAHDERSFEGLRGLARDAGLAWRHASRGRSLGSVGAAEWSQAWRAGFLKGARAVLGAAGEAVRSACALAGVLGLPADDGVPAARRAMLERLAMLASDAASDDLRPALGADVAALQEALGPAVRHLEGMAEARAGLSAEYGEIPRIPVGEIDRSWRQAAAKSWPFSSGARKGVSKLLATYSRDGTRAPDVPSELARLRTVQEGLGALAGSPLAASPAFEGAETDPAALRAWVARASDLRAVTELVAGAGGSAEACGALAAPDAGDSDLARAAGAFAAAMDALHGALSSHRAHAGGAPELGGLGELVAEFEGMLNEEEHLQSRVRWNRMRQTGGGRGLGPLLDSLEAGDLEPDPGEGGAVEAAFCRAYFRWWLPLALDGSEALRTFQGWEYEEMRRAFCSLDEESERLAPGQVRLALANVLPSREAVPSNSELGALRHQLGLKRPSMSIRDLIARMPTAFTKLTPCVLMSPLSIAQYMPPGGRKFDLVIFDEASQITTWDAVGSITRGRQTVIVGDPKQLPPTNFFARAGEDEEGLEYYERDMPSILDEVASRGLPTHHLRWHYRSRDEALIAFSNRNYYGGRLITFPSPATGNDAVVMHRVDGMITPGARSRLTNRIEADAVVEFVVGRMRAELARPEGDRQTFGVVTFNMYQSDLILDLFEAERRRDPALEWFFDDSREEPTIVKNLENIQGDERGVMVFSVTFAPDDAGRMRMNFGPLNQDGGERRLNVAITRAREELHVFASFDPDKIDLTRTKAAGARDLKRFLDYAKRGPVALPQADEGELGPPESPFEEAVAAALEGRGWEVRHQIGVSGFRIDLAVINPGHAGAFIAGIECDGYTYHSSATARDRDRIRDGVLTELGWNILRVWSIDWFQNPDAVAGRLDKRLRELLAGDAERRSAGGAPGDGAPGTVDRVSG